MSKKLNNDVLEGKSQNKGGSISEPYLLQMSEEYFKEVIGEAVNYGKNDGWNWEDYFFKPILKELKEKGKSSR